MSMSRSELQELAAAAAVELERRRCLSSTLHFTQFTFAKIKREPFIVNEHHRIICDALDQVFAGKIKRLIINIAPRYTKTELAVKSFIKKGFAHNPRAKFIHLSYSDSLALANSNDIREHLKHEVFRRMFPQVTISNKTDSKKKWETTAGGGVYATSTGGQVTGFGAGAIEYDAEAAAADIEEYEGLSQALEELEQNIVAPEDEEWIDPYSGFAGAIVIDDPIKPEDALSEVKRARINDRFENTIRSRTNGKNTPIIVIGQRVHEMDLTGYLLSTEPEEWTVIKLPCLKEDGTSLWELKHPVQELLRLQRINPYVFESQLQQDPKPVKRGGEFYKLFSPQRNVIVNPMGPQRLPKLYDPAAALHVTYDFNVNPYMAIGVWQLWRRPDNTRRAIKIDEIPARSPHNKTDAASRLVLARYGEHAAGMFIYGDPSGKKEDTRTEKGQNDFTIIRRVLAKFKPGLRVFDKAPSVAMRGSFINSIFEYGVDGVEVLIGENCFESIKDFQFLKEDSDGTKLKEVATDLATGVPSQKYGHFSDGDDYFLTYIFSSEYASYQKGGVPTKITMGKSASKNSY